MDLHSTWRLVKTAVSSWKEDYAPSMGAALAYYTMFSIAPLLLIVIAVAGMVFGEDAARGEILAQLRGLIGEDGALAIQGLLRSVDERVTGTTVTLTGAVFLFVGSTTVFAELQASLDRIWRAPALAQRQGIWGLLRRRVLSFGMILCIGFLLMVSLVAGAALAALGRWWGPLFEGWEAVAQGIDFALSFAMTTLVFALIYKIMPRVHIRWHDVWIGAAVTALLFTVGKLLIGLYLGKSGVASVFGAAASLVVMLIWVYYSAQIFLMGAEFTWVYAHTFGSRKGQPMPGRSQTVPAKGERDDSGAAPVH